MHNNDFDILLRKVNYSAKQQMARIHKNAEKITVGRTTLSSEVFKFSYL